MNAVRACGWSGIVSHFRGCSGELNHRPRAYHSGDSTDRLGPAPPAPGAPEADDLRRRRLARRQCAAQVAGRARFLAEQHRRCRSLGLRPLDLAVCGHHLGPWLQSASIRSISWNTLKATAAESCAASPASSTSSACAAPATCTVRRRRDAPLHRLRATPTTTGCGRRQSRWLRGIRVPTLVLNARNDPFLPAHALPHDNEVSGKVTLHQPHEGGHVGFVSGSLPGRLDWLPRRLLHFFEHRN